MVEQYKKIKIACIGNYPPRNCGIATFTEHLTEAIGSAGDDRVEAETFIVAMNDQEYDYPEEVRFAIRQGHQRDYLKAARDINYSDADVCLLQHEFGIFGGDDGVYILQLLHRLQIPFMVTLHTVLKNPTPGQKAIIQDFGRHAAKIIVMSRLAVEFLTEIYGVPAEKIVIIEHGVPVFDFDNHELYKEKFNISGRRALLTFGLLGRNKGIETVIKALPAVVKRHPDLIYMVLGKTHPHVVKTAGEEYRIYLQRMVNELELEEHVYFKDQFVSEEELVEYLSASDIYVTPYLTEAQITSGTLAYAVGAGAAVLSTPYWHACELLAEGRGRLFDFKDSAQLANILNELLDDADNLQALRRRAFEYGQGISWPATGQLYRAQALAVAEAQPLPEIKAAPLVDPQTMPVFDLAHLMRMTDDTGLIQHAKYNIPDRNHGYCIDDNARALLMISMAYRQKKSPEALKLMPIYLSFIHHMQKEDGTFHNFLSYDRQFLDEKVSKDAFGRTIWALGHLICKTDDESWRSFALDIFNRARGHFADIASLRGWANMMIGLAYYLKRYPGDGEVMEHLRARADYMVSVFEDHSDGEWQWFEDDMSYDNGILPLALFYAYELIGDERYLETAERAARFLDSVVFADGIPAPVGSNGWYARGGECARYAQQPVDIMSVVIMHRRAYAVTGQPGYLKRMLDAFGWFLGDNDLGLPLYDFESKGCCDGLEKSCVNRNQGAESLLAYLVSHLCILQASEEENLEYCKAG